MEFSGVLFVNDRDHFNLGGKHFIIATCLEASDKRKLISKQGQDVTLITKAWKDPSMDSFANNADHCFIETLLETAPNTYEVVLGS